MALVERKVLAGSIVVRTGKEGKQARRYDHNQVVKLDDRFNNIDVLEARKAIGPVDADSVSTYQQVVASNKHNQAARMQLLDSGEVPQAEDEIQPGGSAVNPLDDGGVGSTPTPAPGDKDPEPGSTLK